MNAENIAIEELSAPQLRVNLDIDATNISPLEQLRRSKTLYIPPGTSGFYQLLYELHDHDFPLKVTSLYFKLGESSYPAPLLNKIKAHSLVKKRNKAVSHSLESGRTSVVEILNEESIWDLIRTDRNGNFIVYPRDITASDVISHIDHLIRKLELIPNYELILTSTSLPFYAVTYEINNCEGSERFTIFFQSVGNPRAGRASCFAVKDSGLDFSITAKFIDTTFSHSSSIRDKSSVVKKLNEVKTHLTSEGPL